MDLNHVSLVCGSEANSDRFYKGLLGLEKQRRRVLDADLSEQIFGLRCDIVFINYGNDRLMFEIFIVEQYERPQRPVHHICLEVDGRDEFLQQCEALGVRVQQIPRGDSLLVFVQDTDGNLFEIK